MTGWHKLGAAALLLLVSQPLRTQPPPADRRAVQRGMSQPEVRRLLGPPAHICRQIMFRRHLEQWVYDDPAAWIEFDCVRGEEATVRQKSASPKTP
jgi:hypothetical protein